MNRRFEARIAALAGADAGLVRAGPRGLEKESLRVDPEGYIAATAHPDALGSALTHRYITTDYSEALLEFVTPPLTQTWEVIQFLCDIHQFVCAEIGDELLWALSMPCMVRSEADIPLARYGSSNVGRMKTIYRRGLGYRYGRYMQVIAGVHFNYSLPDAFWPVYQELEQSRAAIDDFRSAAYLALVRNVRRLDWLLLYLFGASPAVCKSFLRHADTSLHEFDSGTLYEPYATSLRMSDIGYQNTNQSILAVSANSLEEYIRDLERATRTPHPQYREIGARVGAGYRQLNVNQLQIENEYYSTIRPKRIARSGERPTAALRRGGVEYVELRALDVNPFEPVGINQRQMRFLEAFLIFCMLLDSPPIAPEEQQRNERNHALVAYRGRQPGLVLDRNGVQTPLADWAAEILEQMQPICEMLDAGDAPGYAAALTEHRALLDDPDRTPAGRLLGDLRETGKPLFLYGLDLSRAYKDYFLELAPELNRHRELLLDESRASVERQAAIESADRLSFEAYLERYFS